MVPSGKAQLSATEAAAAFVREIIVSIRDDWPSLQAELDPVLQPTDRALLENRWTQFEFAIAAMAEESQAISHLLPADLGNRVLSYVTELLDGDDLEGAGLESFNAYRDAWRRGLNQNEPPFEEVASVLYSRVGFQASVTMGGTKCKDPLLLMAISSALLKPGRGWWKRTLTIYDVVE